MSLLDAMEAGCREISAEDCQGWIRHAKRFHPRSIARENIRCDVDENMWPNAEDSIDFILFFSIFLPKCKGLYGFFFMITDSN